MSAWGYYEAERRRHAGVNDSRCSRAEAEAAIRIWSRKYHTPRLILGGRIGSGSSGSAWVNRINLTYDRGPTPSTNWLIVAHEYAHVLQLRFGAHEERRGHRPLHARNVDELCADLLGRGWDRGALAYDLALREERLEQKAAARPSDRQLLMARREAQVKRLRTRIKALTTRLKKAERSLTEMKRKSVM